MKTYRHCVWVDEHGLYVRVLGRAYRPQEELPELLRAAARKKKRPRVDVTFHDDQRAIIDGMTWVADVADVQVADVQYTYPVEVYLRCVDQGTDNECWVVCAKGDPGAVKFTPA